MPVHPPSSVFHPRRLLVRGVNWLGDAVMTTPALARLRERFPAADIRLLTPAKLADLWRHHPSLDGVVPFHAGEGLFTVARRLREVFGGAGNGRAETSPAFDLALVLPNSPRSALEAWLARIPCRVGYARPWRNWCLTHALPSRPDRVVMRKRTPAEVRRLLAAPPPPTPALAPGVHQVHEYLHLVAALGADPASVAPRLRVLPEEVAAAQTKFGLRPDELWLGLNPGAEYGPAKRWPAAHFIAAAREVSAATGARWLVFGGPGDAALAGEISAGLGAGARCVAGQTTLRELLALLAGCRVLLTNDTGPMHVAAALGTPVVVPFGSTSPELTGPGLPGDARHRILRGNAPCAPCFLRECPADFRCLRDVEPAAAVRAVRECLAAAERL